MIYWIKVGDTMAISVEVWGDYACFTRPEYKAERISYDVITPSAARGILDSIYWHPGMCWVIDKIRVCNPIETMGIMRNEIGAKISARSISRDMDTNKHIYMASSNHIQQRTTMLLKNVRYIIDAHFILTDQAAEPNNTGKFQSIIRRRLKKGQCYQMPYFGMREYPASFAPCDEEKMCPEELKGTYTLGKMLYDMDYSNKNDIKACYFDAVMVDGVIDLTDVEVIK